MTEPLLDSLLPIAAAPMAGGPTTVALARAVAEAGAFPFLAGGYKTAAALAEETRQLRSTTSDFGVNLFTPSTDAVNEATFAAYVNELNPEAGAYGLELDPTPFVDEDHWDEKLRLLIEEPVPLVSFTFGLPRRLRHLLAAEGGKPSTRNDHHSTGSGAGTRGRRGRPDRAGSSSRRPLGNL
ncbi:nitronate monooxygenase [Streptomyces olivaceus]|uniref:nitronate monooxygenase n=1 Tax=Streptomyces olivaceus TaxID=47716 RepID=UPI0037F57AFB